MNAFSRRRYPAHGAIRNYFHFDLVGHTDKLMSEIGLRSHRKGSWWSDLMSSCLASDLKNIKSEYVSKFQSSVIFTLSFLEGVDLSKMNQ